MIRLWRNHLQSFAPRGAKHEFKSWAAESFLLTMTAPLQKVRGSSVRSSSPVHPAPRQRRRPEDQGEADSDHGAEDPYAVLPYRGRVGLEADAGDIEVGVLAVPQGAGAASMRFVPPSCLGA